ncbi:MAG: DUF1559 domain-containing protein, partial [Verrucomicrobia bacterium]|nr:DUF1559 domain-containing protein [Verrucomicrobiota bacterium]
MHRANVVGIVVGMTLIAVLTWMMLVSVMCRARNRPRSLCLSNLKQIGLALKQYSQDYGDRYPWRVGATRPGEA